MKNLLFGLVLILSTNGILIAQQNQTDNKQVFELPKDHATKRFTIDLGKGNRMQVEISDMADLNRFANIDSILRVFLADIEPFRDSLSDELSIKRIDYRADSSRGRKIRITQTSARGSSYLVQDGDIAALKLDQDTIHLLGTIPYTAKVTLRKAFQDYRHYRVSFFLNNVWDIRSYLDGTLNEKISHIQESQQQNPNRVWLTDRQKKHVYLAADPTISANLPKGNIHGGDYMNLRVSVDIQNYKNYFVPSFSLGLGVILSKNNFKRDIVLSWDPNFLFSPDADGKLRRYRNDFVTLTWGQGIIKDNDPRKESHLMFIMSLGYLVKREGEYFDRNTFRMGAGRLSLFNGKTKFEPVLYFNNFFKAASPGLRMIQSF